MDDFDKDAWYGDVNTAAAAMIEKADRTGKPFEWEWCGTPIVARPGDQRRHVIERWSLTRTIWQLKHGVISVRDL